MVVWQCGGYLLLFPAHNLLPLSIPSISCWNPICLLYSLLHLRVGDWLRLTNQRVIILGLYDLIEEQ
jgi:hypothetical protein